MRRPWTTQPETLTVQAVYDLRDFVDRRKSEEHLPAVAQIPHFDAVARKGQQQPVRRRNHAGGRLLDRLNVLVGEVVHGYDPHHGRTCRLLTHLRTYENRM